MEMVPSHLPSLSTVAFAQQCVPAPGTSMRLLITDGNERAALAVARALVAAGFEVYVAAPNRLCLAGVSRGVHHSVVRIHPFADPAGYAPEMVQRAAELGTRVLVPVPDA